MRKSVIIASTLIAFSFLGLGVLAPTNQVQAQGPPEAQCAFNPNGTAFSSSGGGECEDPHGLCVWSAITHTLGLSATKLINNETALNPAVLMVVDSFEGQSPEDELWEFTIPQDEEDEWKNKYLLVTSVDIGKFRDEDLSKTADKIVAAIDTFSNTHTLFSERMKDLVINMSWIIQPCSKQDEEPPVPPYQVFETVSVRDEPQTYHDDSCADPYAWCMSQDSSDILIADLGNIFGESTLPSIPIGERGVQSQFMIGDYGIITDLIDHSAWSSEVYQRIIENHNDIASTNRGWSLDGTRTVELLKNIASTNQDLSPPEEVPFTQLYGSLYDLLTACFYPEFGALDGIDSSCPWPDHNLETINVINVAAAGNGNRNDLDVRYNFPFVPGMFESVVSVSDSNADETKYKPNAGELAMDGQHPVLSDEFGTSYAAPRFSILAAKFLLQGGEIPCRDGLRTGLVPNIPPIDPPIYPPMGFMPEITIDEADRTKRWNNSHKNLTIEDAALEYCGSFPTK